MTDSASDLEIVSFENPPVEEVAFAVQLAESVLGLEDMVDIGRRLAEELPVRQLQPSLPRMTEPTGSPSFSISASVGVPLPRFWFVSPDGLRLVQLQEDRIAFNWRRLGREVSYPRYWRLREEFVQYLGRITATAPALGELRADFCELTYVNELAGPSPHAALPPLDAVLRVMEPLGEAAFLPPPKETQWSGRWDIGSASGERPGLLTATTQPVLRQRDSQQIYLLTMTATMSGELNGCKAVLRTLDYAHEWIVRGFVDLTTEEMQAVWKRTR